MQLQSCQKFFKRIRSELRQQPAARVSRVDIEVVDRQISDIAQAICEGARSDILTAKLRRLEAEHDENWHADGGKFAIWGGSRWRVSAGSFVWWVGNNAIAGTQKAVDFEQWLNEREYKGLLTHGNKEKLRELAGKIPKSVVTKAGEFLQVVSKDYLIGGGG